MIEIPLARFFKSGRGGNQGKLRSKKGPLEDSHNEKFEHRPANGTSFFITHFLCLIAVSGCASLPNVQTMTGHELSGSDEPTKIMGPKGKLSSKTSKAMIKRLEGQVDATKLLEQQVQLMQSVSGSLLVAGNKVTLLIDGEATYAAMFEAIQNAKDHINFETFIFEMMKSANDFPICSSGKAPKAYK